MEQKEVFSYGLMFVACSLSLGLLHLGTDFLSAVPGTPSLVNTFLPVCAGLALLATRQPQLAAFLYVEFLGLLYQTHTLSGIVFTHILGLALGRGFRSRGLMLVFCLCLEIGMLFHVPGEVMVVVIGITTCACCSRREDSDIESVLGGLSDGVLVVCGSECVLHNDLALQLTATSNPQAVLTLLKHLIGANVECSRCLGILDVSRRKVEVRTTAIRWRQQSAVVLTLRDVTHLTVLEQMVKHESAAKDTLLRSVSHELRTPVNCIANLSTELVSCFDLEKLKILRGCSFTLLTLVNNLIDYAQLLSDSFELEKTAFHPEAVIRDWVEIFSCFAAAKNLQLRLEVDPGLPAQCFNDPARLSQVLSALITSAIKRTSEGTIFITVVSPTSTKLRISISDTCTNYQEIESVEKELGKEMHEASSHLLELCVIARIASLIGECPLALRRHSTVGSTCTFWVTLSDPPQTTLTQFSSEDLSEEVGERLRDMSSFNISLPTFNICNFLQVAKPLPVDILVVDDTPFNRMVLRSILETEGFSIEEACDGQKCVDLILSPQGRSRSFRLVIMDVDMPVMDGLEATSVLKRMEQIRQFTVPPIIGHSAFTSEADVKKCISVGMAAFLPKPCDRRVVLDVVRTYALPR